MPTGPEGALCSAGLLCSGQYGGKAVLSQEEGKSFQHPCAILQCINDWKDNIFKNGEIRLLWVFFYFRFLFFECIPVFF